MMDLLKTGQPVRLSLLAEGEFWNAYLAPVGTMEGAVLIGSIRSEAVTDYDTRDAFMAVMAAAADAMIRAAGNHITGKTDWRRSTAPKVGCA